MLANGMPRWLAPNSPKGFHELSLVLHGRDRTDEVKQLTQQAQQTPDVANDAQWWGRLANLFRLTPNGMQAIKQQLNLGQPPQPAQSQPAQPAAPAAQPAASAPAKPAKPAKPVQPVQPSTSSGIPSQPVAYNQAQRSATVNRPRLASEGIGQWVGKGLDAIHNARYVAGNPQVAQAKAKQNQQRQIGHAAIKLAFDYTKSATDQKLNKYGLDVSKAAKIMLKAAARPDDERLAAAAKRIVTVAQA
jgi:hypothetical protein